MCGSDGTECHISGAPSLSDQSVFSGELSHVSMFQQCFNVSTKCTIFEGLLCIFLVLKNYFCMKYACYKPWKLRILMQNCRDLPFSQGQLPLMLPLNTGDHNAPEHWLPKMFQQNAQNLNVCKCKCKCKWVSKYVITPYNVLVFAVFTLFYNKTLKTKPCKVALELIFTWQNHAIP